MFFRKKGLFAQELQSVVGEDPQAVIDYLKTAEKAYTSIGHIFLHFSLHKLSTWFNKRIFAAIGATKLEFLTLSMHQYHQKKFKAAHTVQLFNRFATYNGSNPYEAPAMLSMIPHLEQNEGTFYPQGGMISITNALYNLALKLGVQFHFSTPIEKIIHENGKVTGVIALGKNHSAPLVITNSDVFYLYNDLIQQPKEAAKTLKRERSSSALIFYWGIKKQFAQLDAHNIFFSVDYREEFRLLFEGKTLSDDPTVYVHITSKHEKTDAPENCSNWFVMVNVPPNNGQDWDKLIAETKINVIKKLNRLLQTNLEPYIENESVLDPRKIEKNTSSFGGSLYGNASNNRFAAFLRHPNFSNKIKGLYFCGGSVHPGGGIPLCLNSGKIVAEMIN